MRINPDVKAAVPAEESNAVKEARESIGDLCKSMGIDPGKSTENSPPPPRGTLSVKNLIIMGANYAVMGILSNENYRNELKKVAKGRNHNYYWAVAVEAVNISSQILQVIETKGA